MEVRDRACAPPRSLKLEPAAMSSCSPSWYHPSPIASLPDLRRPCSCLGNNEKYEESLYFFSVFFHFFFVFSVLYFFIFYFVVYTHFCNTSKTSKNHGQEQAHRTPQEHPDARYLQRFRHAKQDKHVSAHCVEQAKIERTCTKKRRIAYDESPSRAFAYHHVKTQQIRQTKEYCRHCILSLV